MRQLPLRGIRERERDDRIRDLINGQSNAVGTVTLTPSAATTVVTNKLVSERAIITFMPRTANAAAELATLYVAPVVNGQFTINHANNAQADRTFGYKINGT